MPLMECEIFSNMNFVSNHIVDLVTFLCDRVSKEDSRLSSGGEFGSMHLRCGHIAKTTKGL